MAQAVIQYTAKMGISLNKCFEVFSNKSWCKFGATLYRAILTILHEITRYSRYSRYQTVLLKLEEIISTLSNTKNAPIFRSIFCLSLGEQLNLPVWASEVIFDSEVHFVNEVSPISEVANLTSLMRSTNFTVLHTTSLLPKAKTSPLPYHFRAPRSLQYRNHL